MRRHTDQEYINADPFEGDEAEMTCRTIAIRTARKAHLCYGLAGQQNHLIHPGERYRHERARVDGSFWGQYRICLGCMDRFMAVDY